MSLAPEFFEILDPLLPHEHDHHLALAFLGALKKFLVNLVYHYLLIDGVCRFLGLKQRGLLQLSQRGLLLFRGVRRFLRLVLAYTRCDRYIFERISQTENLVALVLRLAL